MYASAVAKIESGQRAVRIEEAEAIAELFGVSVDSLLGRQVGVERDLAYSLRGVLASTRQCGRQMEAVRDTFTEALSELINLDFPQRELVEEDAVRAVRAMDDAKQALLRISEFRLPADAAVTMRIERILDASLNQILAELEVYGPTITDAAKGKVKRNVKKP